MSQENNLKKICIIGDKDTVNKLCNQKLNHLNAYDHDVVIGFINYQGSQCSFEEIPFKSDTPALRRTSSNNLLLLTGPLWNLKNKIAEADVIFIAGNLEGKEHHISPADLSFPMVTSLNNKSTPKFYLLGHPDKKKSAEIQFFKKPMEYISDIDEFKEKFNNEAHSVKQPTSEKEDVRIPIAQMSSQTYASRPKLTGFKAGFFISAGTAGTIGILAAAHVIPFTPVVMAAIAAFAAVALLCVIIASCINKAAMKAQPQTHLLRA